MQAGLHREPRGSNPLSGKLEIGKVLPSLVAHIGLMSHCECRWNYSLLSSWSRVRVPSAPILGGRSSVVEHDCFTNPCRNGASLVLAVNANGTTGKRTRLVACPVNGFAGLPGSSPGPAMDGGKIVSSTLVTAFLLSEEKHGTELQH